MAFTNSQTTTLIEAAKAGTSLESATVRFAKRIAEMKAAGWTSELLKGGTETRKNAAQVLADNMLSPKDLALFNDTDKKEKIPCPKGTRDTKGNIKRINTPRGNVTGRINRRIQDMAKALAKLESGPVTKETKQPGAPRPLPTRILEELGNLKKAVKNDKDKAEPSLLCDHGELMTAFTQFENRVKDIMSGH